MVAARDIFYRGLGRTADPVVPLRDGKHVPISQWASIEIKKGPPGIKSLNARRTAWVYVDIRCIDVGTYVKQAQEAVIEKMELHPGYSLVWSGQFEYMEAAKKRFLVVVPLTVLIIFVIIYMSTRSVTKIAIVFLPVPFSLAGLDAETGVVMLLYLDRAHTLWDDNGRMNTHGDLVQAIHHGAVKRI